MNRVVPYFKFLRPVRYAFAIVLVFGAVRGVASGFGLPFASQKVFPILFGTPAPSTATLNLVVSILPVAILVRGV